MKKTVFVKDVAIGGKNPVVIQSMTNTKTEDTLATIKQVKELNRAGAEIVRVSVPNSQSLKTIQELSKGSIPIVADIHFDYKLAIKSVEYGAHKIRINPSNIPSYGIVEIVKHCKEKNIPIRVGVNK
ncbi:MAG: flavodoxin-dependent (E)-4-hydroxy-3-methylbut-2-enyl-diphosphate synthase, partial [Bacillota bacterium]